MNRVRHLIGIFFVLIISCSPNNENKINPFEDSILSGTNVNKEHADSIFEIIKEINYGNYKLRITTICQRDSVLSEEKNLFNPIVLNQIFEFRKNDSFIKKISLPIRLIAQKVYGGKTKRMQDCVLFNVKLIRREDSTLIYHIEGYGGCNGDCPFCDAIFNIEGTLIAFDYRTVDEIIEHKGSSAYLLEILQGPIKGDIVKELNFYP